MVWDTPLCSTLVLDESRNFELSCRWSSREAGDKIALKARNQTLLSYPNDELASRAQKLRLSWSSATVFGITMAIPDAFDGDRIPDACTVSNSRLEFENQCKFSVFMMPKTNEITQPEQEVSFTCCTESENVPSIWWYNVTTFATAIIAKEQFFTVDISSQSSDVGLKSDFFFICGEHDRHDMHISFRIGKLELDLEYQGGVILLGNIESGRSSPNIPIDDGNCTWSHVISISVAQSTSGLGLSTSHFSAFDHLETVILVSVLFAVSILLNIAFCMTKCSKIFKSSNSSATEGNEIRDTPQTNPTSGMYGGGALERNKSPNLTEPQIIPPQVLAGNEHLKHNTTQKHTSGKSKGEQCGSVRSVTGALSSLDDPSYDILNRPEIEHLV